MKKIILGMVLITLIIILCVSIYYVIAQDSDNSAIPPYDGPQQGDPDSGNGDPNSVSIALRITAPSNPYSVPESGDYYGKYQNIRIFGRIYGLNASKVGMIQAKWVDTDYSTWRIYPQDEHWTKINDYNYDFEITPLIQRLGRGMHLLSLQAKKNHESNQVLAEATLEVNIPDHWVYHWDSRNPVDSDEIIRGSTGNGKYFYGFTFPYQTDSNNWVYLEGKIMQVNGQIHVEDNSRNWAGVTIWNGEKEKWKDYDNFDTINPPTSGWSTDFTVNTMEVWGNAIGFGSHIGSTIDGFIGEIWFEPGTVEFKVLPLDFLFNLFNNDSLDSPPHP